MAMLGWILNLQPHHVNLLGTARRLANDGQNEISVVTALMACEIFVEQVFTALYQHKDILFLEDPIESLLPSHNLNNDRVRSLYVALTEDRIQDQPFWRRFKEASKLRNAAIHKGQRVSKQQAEDACSVVEQVVQHVSAVVRAIAGS